MSTTTDAAKAPAQDQAERENEGQALRRQAYDLLQRAQALDGLKPYNLQFENRHGHGAYLCWSRAMPTEAQSILVLEANNVALEGESFESTRLFLNTITGLDGTSCVPRLEERAAADAVEGQGGDEDEDGAAEAGEGRIAPRAA